MSVYVWMNINIYEQHDGDVWIDGVSVQRRQHQFLGDVLEGRENVVVYI